ncbi:MAG: hypothetical protein ACF8Q5_03295 [Phycisphaerales bacterium JB040]
MSRRRAWLAGVLPVVPPLLIIAVRFVGHAPTGAGAFQGPGAGAEDGLGELARFVPEEVHDPRLHRAWESSRELLAGAWRRQEADPDPDAPVVSPAEDPAAHAVRTPAFSLTTIFGDGAGGGNAGAVLDGRIYRVGDPVESGWALESVDRAGRSVTLRHRTGAACTIPLSRRRPE